MVQYPREPTKLYRLYDAEGELLYVGITDQPLAARMRGHTHKQDWWDEVDDGTYALYDTRAEADAAETAAILDERPRYNIAKAALRGAGRPRRKRVPASIPEEHASPAGGMSRLPHPAGLQQRGVRIKALGSTYIPHVLSTAEYAEAYLRKWSAMTDASEDEIQQILSARLEGQKILDDPLTEVQVVIMEVALHCHWVCTGAALARQLGQLLAADGYGALELTVVPQGQQLPVAPNRTFAIYDERLLLADSYFGEENSMEPHVVKSYVQRFDLLRSVGLQGAPARELITRAIQALPA